MYSLQFLCFICSWSVPHAPLTPSHMQLEDSHVTCRNSRSKGTRVLLQHVDYSSSLCQCWVLRTQCWAKTEQRKALTSGNDGKVKVQLNIKITITANFSKEGYVFLREAWLKVWSREGNLERCKFVPAQYIDSELKLKKEVRYCNIEKN